MHNQKSPDPETSIRKAIANHPKMTGKKKPAKSGQSFPTGVNLTRKADDITRVLAAHTSIPRATILWHLIGRGFQQWLNDGLIQEPGNPTLEIINRVGEKILDDPALQPAIKQLKADLSLIKFEWEPNGEMAIEVEEED